MTSAVGTARVELTGDVSSFARESERKIRTLMGDISHTIDQSMVGIDSRFGRAGTASGRAFGDRASAELRGARSGIDRSVREDAASAEREAGSSFGRAGRRAGESFRDKAKETMHSMGGAVFAGVGAIGVGEVVKKSVEAADSLEAANIRVEGSFGESGKAVTTWAQTMAAKLGLSQAAAENSAGQFGQMFHAMGLGQEQSSTMAMKLSELTQNVAKFNNADPAAVQQAFTMAMRGRGKALAVLGINLDSTTIAAEAMRHGIVKMHVDTGKVTLAQDAYNKAVQAQQAVDKKTTSTAADKKAATDKVTAAETALTAAMGGKLPVLTASQKGEASYYAILEGTKNQEHAVADSAHTLAQQKKILGAEVQNLEAKLGNALLPTLTKVSEFITGTAIPALSAAGAWVKRNKEWLEPLVLVLLAAVVAYKAVSTAVSAAKAIQQTYTDVTKAFALVKDKEILTQLRSTIALVAHKIALAATTVAQKAATAGQWLLNAAMSANPIAIVVLAILALVAAVVIAYRNSETFRRIVQAAWSGIKSAVAVAWGFIQPILGALGDAFHAVGTGLQWAWNNVISPVFGWIKTAVKGFSAFLGPIITTISNLFANIGDGLQWAWDHSIGYVFGLIRQAVQEVRDAISWLTAAKQGNFGAGPGMPKWANPGKAGMSVFGGNAAGTDNWRGGPTRVNELGGEIINLPRGTQIVPHDVSVAAMRQQAARASGSHTSGGLSSEDRELLAALATRPVIIQVDRREIARAANEGNMRLARR